MTKAISNKIILSIIICTYNRSELLDKCLESLLKKNINDFPFEVILIDNNSTDQTPQICNLYKKKIASFKYCKETQQGLSFGRNRGVKESKAEWIFYLDDDALVTESLFPRLYELVNQQKYKIVGGVYYPWYFYGKPKWYKYQYASNEMPYKKISKISTKIGASGGVLLIKKEIFKEIGLFNTSIGMRGNIIGYGEESEWQKRAEDKGYEIYYDPKLKIKHVVQEYKLKLSWFFNSYYNKGLDISKYPHNQPVLTFMINLPILLGQLLIYPIINTPSIIKKQYYYQNWLIDSFRKPVKRIGILVGSLRRIFS